MNESGFRTPWPGHFRDRLRAAAYLEAPAFLKYDQLLEGPPIFADDAATQPRTHTVARSAGIWTPYRWDPDELRVTTRRAGPRRATRPLTDPSRPSVAALFRGARPLLGRRGRRQVLAATLLAILLAMAVHVSTLGAQVAPISVSTPPSEEAIGLD